MATRAMGIESHPDIAALRARYEAAAETPTAQVVDGLTALSGLYLAASPWIVGFSDLTNLAVTNLIVGIAAALLAVGLVSAYGRTHGVAWIAPVIGAWTIVAPWAVSGNVDTTATIWNNVLTGGRLVLLGIGAMSVGAIRNRP